MLVFADLRFQVYNVLYLVEEPAVYLGKLTDGFDRYARSHSFLDAEYTVPRGSLECVDQFLRSQPAGADEGKTGSIIFQALAGFLQSLGECASDSHHLTYRFHL